MSTLPILSAAAALAPFFPSIMKWIAGAEGEKIAKHILEAAKHITGKEDVQTISKTFSENPKTLIEFQKTLYKIARDYRIEEVNDRTSARTRDVALIQAGRQNFRADIMVISAASGLILCLVSLGIYKTSLPGEAVGIISTIAGIFGSCLKDAYAFEFGSSRGSKEKDLHVGQFLKQLK